MTWDDAWREGRTPWDAGCAAPELERALESEPFGPAKNRRALVPGAGGGHDAIALARAGFEVTALDIAPHALATFERNRDAAEVHARLAIADFFTWTPPARFDLIWDYTFLCALLPTQRHRWIARMDALLAEGGVLATLIFPAVEKDADYQGPPWPLFPEHVQGLVDDYASRTGVRFEASYLERAQRSLPPREGNEWLGLWRRV